jgi:hypothetical protein
MASQVCAECRDGLLLQVGIKADQYGPQTADVYTCDCQCGGCAPAPLPRRRLDPSHESLKRHCGCLHSRGLCTRGATISPEGDVEPGRMCAKCRVGVTLPSQPGRHARYVCNCDCAHCADYGPPGSAGGRGRPSGRYRAGSGPNPTGPAPCACAHAEGRCPHYATVEGGQPGVSANVAPGHLCTDCRKGVRVRMHSGSSTFTCRCPCAPCSESGGGALSGVDDGTYSATSSDSEGEVGGERFHGARLPARPPWTPRGSINPWTPRTPESPGGPASCTCRQAFGRCTHGAETNPDGTVADGQLCARCRGGAHEDVDGIPRGCGCNCYECIYDIAPAVILQVQVEPAKPTIAVGVPLDDAG